MPTPKQIKLRQLICYQYRDGNDKKQARININAQLGKNAILAPTINYWYRRFQARKSLILKQNDATKVIRKLSNGKKVVNF
jgi:hypothetical protein